MNINFIIAVEASIVLLFIILRLEIYLRHKTLLKIYSMPAPIAESDAIAVKYVQSSINRQIIIGLAAVGLNIWLIIHIAINISAYSSWIINMVNNLFS